MKASCFCFMSLAALLIMPSGSAQAFCGACGTGPVYGSSAYEGVDGGTSCCNPYGTVRYGFTPFGFRTLAPNSYGGQYYPSVPEQCPPYEQSYYQYSPTRYSSDPCAQWAYRGCLFGIVPVWAYTPTLIPPRPHADFHCCYNCGICTDENPCCPLCNINGCCEREHAFDGGEPASGQESPKLAPPTEPTHAQSIKEETTTEIPTESSAPASPETPAEPAAAPADDVPADDLGSPMLESISYKPGKVSQISWKSQEEEGVPSNRLSNIDVRSSRGVIFNIWAPNQAKVYVNGYQTKSVGSKRIFASMNLKPGLKYQYVIDAVVEKDGKSYAEQKNVIVSAGAVETVSFAFPELNVIPSDEWDN